MSFRKKVNAQEAHILSLRIALLLMTMIAAYMAYGWKTAPSDLTIHVPPDLRSGSTRKWWDVPPESVYAFGFYIFQQMQRWPRDGEEDYLANISRLDGYLTPSCRDYLKKDYELRLNAGELRKRERSVSEIPGRGISDQSGEHTNVKSINDWIVNLDLIADESVAGERVKRALARYPLHIIRSDTDPEKNPFGLLWNCYAGDPQRIEVSPAGDKP
ncbi:MULTISPECIES: PFL_4703 family integrating conjugative element protein [unclassified Pseudomonas]|uniref:PFL_4703 family integrating conjugative element protein n=1 Tax=unclassified Pseudomonas TaxID=196821 RepID=UPI000A1F8E0C|nr:MULTISPECIES: TIGR03746 family integrating conjugative element protein [unclassified Pseudomonas]UMZ10681.1 TIGR03746 family integrating conjugative element protein [Pseudomonas sp. MPFS]